MAKNHQAQQGPLFSVPGKDGTPGLIWPGWWTIYQPLWKMGKSQLGWWWFWSSNNFWSLASRKKFIPTGRPRYGKSLKNHVPNHHPAIQGFIMIQWDINGKSYNSMVPVTTNQIVTDSDFTRVLGWFNGILMEKMMFRTTDQYICMMQINLYTVSPYISLYTIQSYVILHQPKSCLLRAGSPIWYANFRSQVYINVSFGFKPHVCKVVRLKYHLLVALIPVSVA